MNSTDDFALILLLFRRCERSNENLFNKYSVEIPSSSWSTLFSKCGATIHSVGIQDLENLIYLQTLNSRRWIKLLIAVASQRKRYQTTLLNKVKQSIMDVTESGAFSGESNRRDTWRAKQLTIARGSVFRVCGIDSGSGSIRNNGLVR